MSFTKTLIRDIETLSSTLDPNQLKQFLDIMDTMSALLAKAQHDAEQQNAMATTTESKAKATAVKSAFH